MRMRIRRLESREQPSGMGIGLLEWFKRLPELLSSWSIHEFQVSSSQQGLRVDYFPESYWYIFLAWFLSTGTICHILFGTVIFSSLLFVGPNDAMTVVARYMGSVIVCRVVLMYELSGLRDAKKRADEGIVYGQTHTTVEDRGPKAQSLGYQSTRE